MVIIVKKVLIQKKKITNVHPQWHLVKWSLAKKSSLLLIIFLVTTSVALGQPKRITVQELKGMIDKKADVLVVDVRTRQWYEKMHLPGAISLPEGDLVNRHDELPKDKLIIFYCG